MRWIATVLVLAAAGCAAAAPHLSAPAAPIVQQPVRAAPCPDENPGFRECMARREAAAMAATGGRVSRTGDSLVIRGAAAALVLEDDTTEGAGTRVYRYDRHLAEIGFHLVEIGLYEGGGWLLVDARTTDQTPILGPPAVSPGRTRFAAASVDLEAGYDPNGIQIWRLRDGAPTLEYGLDGGDSWGASGPVWRGENDLDFTRHDRAPDPSQSLTTRMRLTLTGPGLQIRPATP